MCIIRMLASQVSVGSFLCYLFSAYTIHKCLHEQSCHWLHLFREILGILCEMNKSMTIGDLLFRQRGNLDLENILATASLSRFLLARIPIMSFFPSVGQNVFFYSLLLEI